MPERIRSGCWSRRKPIKQKKSKPLINPTTAKRIDKGHFDHFYENGILGTYGTSSS
jgi:hypothetical protein